MTALERLQAERDCERLVHLFVHAVDHREYETLRQVLAADAVFDRLGTRFEGLEAILGYMATRPPELFVRHVCTNLLVDVTSPDAASGSSYFTFFRSSQPSLVGEYRDTFKRTASGWRIATRTVELCFKEAA